MVAAARGAAESAARTSYGRLLAYLAARTRDVAACEDALADAFRTALLVWPERGVPDSPEAWLLTVARRNLLRGVRHAGVQAAGVPTLRLLADEAAEAMDGVDFPDDRLKLLFVCAHPAIDPAARAPLMLQTVLGLDAARIASAFLTAPATMGQRLVRAKARIRDAGISFQVPDRSELPERLSAVLDAIYAAYGSGWDDVSGSDPRRRDLAEEAIWLGALLVRMLPDAAEAHGLLALMLFCEARKPARRTADGTYVPLAVQDTALWSAEMIGAAEQALAAAGRLRAMGRFQVEAAIQSAHVHHRLAGGDIWPGLVLLYGELARVHPTLGALVGRAAAVAEATGARAGLDLLDGLPAARDAYQPYWALRAHLLARCGDPEAARAAYGRAIGLAEDPAVRDWLIARSASLERP